jgi:apolipoprotein N-acyltransferase
LLADGCQPARDIDTFNFMMKLIKSVFKNSWFLVVLSALLLRLAFPKFNLFILAWGVFLPFFFAVSSQRPLKGFFISWFGGVLFYILTVFWLIHVTAAGMVVLSVYLGLYFAFFALGYKFAREHLLFWPRLFFVPAWWVVLEYSRGYLLTGFPWALLAYTQTQDLFAIQAADIFGSWGVSFIVIFANVFLFELIVSCRKGPFLKKRQVIIPLLIFVCWFAYGIFRVYENPKKSCPLSVAVVQGNISQEIKWVPSFGKNIFKKYQLLTDIVRLKEAPDLVIWPETSFPDYLEPGINDGELKEYIRKGGTPLLLGSIRLEGAHYFNSAILFSSTGDILGCYDKIHLVPFGEYIPLRRLLPFLERIVPIEDFRAGTNYKIFSIHGPRCPLMDFGVLICFEDIFSSLSSRFVRRGADFLVNITNDAWFGNTASPFEHMQASVFRAVENRVFVVRSANAGISCIIDDKGRPVASVKDAAGNEAFVTGSKAAFIYKPARKSLYTKIGDVFVFICFLSVIGIGLWRRHPIKRKN